MTGNAKSFDPNVRGAEECMFDCGRGDCGGGGKVNMGAECEVTCCAELRAKKGVGEDGGRLKGWLSWAK